MAYFRAVLLLFFIVPFGTSVQAASPIASHECHLAVPGVAIRCGTLTVPEHRTGPADSRTMRLDYAVLGARTKASRADPIVFLTGGPGFSALFFLRNLAASPLRANREIIAVEQRGAGYSAPNLVCSAGADVEGSADAPAAYSKCRTELEARGVNFDAYNSTEASHDLEDLRRAMGVRRWNVVGTSYGVFWALRYAGLHPGGIRSMLLDSPYPLQADPANDWILQLNALTAAFAACRSDDACNRAYPKLEERFVRLHHDLSRATRTTGDTQLTADDFYRLVTHVGYETASVRFLPRLIDAVERNDATTVAAITQISAYSPPDGFDLSRVFAAGLNIGMVCIEDMFPAGPGARVSVIENWPGSIVSAARQSVTVPPACRRQWPVTRADPVLNRPLHSAIPTLVMVGELDPITPPVYARAVAATLTRATVAVVPRAAHAVMSVPTPCTAGIVTRFVNDPGRRPRLNCLMKKKPFSLPGDPVGLDR